MKFTPSNFLPPFGLGWPMFFLVFASIAVLNAIINPPLWWQIGIGLAAWMTCLAWADHHGTRG